MTIADFTTSDPFAPIPLLVATRSVERWYRRALAHRFGIAAGLEFVGLDAALDAAVAAALGLPGTAPDRWWRSPADDPWSSSSLVSRTLSKWHEAWNEPDLASLRAYVDPLGLGRDAPASWRQVHLAQQFVDVYRTASRIRPQEAVGWAAGHEAPAGSPPWFAATLRLLQLDREGPAWARAAVLDPTAPLPRLAGPPMVLIGVTAISGTDRALLERFAAHHPVEWHRPTIDVGRWTPGAAPDLSPDAEAFLVVEEFERLAWQGAAASSVRLLPTAGHPGGGPPSAALAVWQHMLRAETPPPLAPGDGPLPQLQACWSPQREIEALRDTLLTHFEAERLEPRDVLVLTPDIATYGPLIQSVFARPGSQAPAIPVVITQLGLSQTNPMADALLRALELCDDRFTAPDLLALLSLAPAQNAAGLTPDDVADLGELLKDSGARWGLEAADKVPVYGKAIHENTLEFGLERMALGVVMPDEAVPEEDAAPAPLQPMPTGDRERVHRVARLMAVVERFRQVRTALHATTRDAAGWRDFLLGTLAELVRPAASQAWLELELRDTLAEVLPALDGLAISLEAVRHLLRARFDLPVRARGSNVSAVTVQPLTPQGVSPHPFVALVGMNTGAFPRVARPLAWAPKPTPGTPAVHASEALDRQALAQALAWATDDVFISWTGHEPRRGQPLPPCVPVDELIDMLASAGADRSTVVTHGTRHPWSAERPGPWFDAPMVRASQAVPVRAPMDTGALRPEATPPTEVSLSQFADDLSNGAKLLLYRRLGMYMATTKAPLSEREPLELDSLEAWALRKTLVSTAVALGGLDDELDEDLREAIVARIVAEHRARGELPLRAGAEFVVTKRLEEAEKVLKNARKLYTGDVWHDDGPLKLQVGLPCGLTLAGLAPPRAASANGSVHHWIVAGKQANAKQLMRAWIHLLAAAAQGTDAQFARVTPVGTANWLSAPDDPVSTLDLLGRIWQLGRRRPLLLLPRCNHALAMAMIRKPKADDDQDPRTRAERAVVKVWTTAQDRPGDEDDAYVRSVFGDWSPKDCLPDFGVRYSQVPEVDDVPTINQLTQLVWGPLVAHRSTDRGLLTHWQD